MRSNNPENPYVFNEQFFSNVTNLPYEKSTFDLIHSLNNYTAAILGAFSILLVQYLIVFRTPRQFREFSKILLLCTISDSVYLTSDFCTQTVGFLS